MRVTFLAATMFPIAICCTSPGGGDGGLWEFRECYYTEEEVLEEAMGPPGSSCAYLSDNEALERRGEGVRQLVARIASRPKETRLKSRGVVDGLGRKQGLWIERDIGFEFRGAYRDGKRFGVWTISFDGEVDGWVDHSVDPPRAIMLFDDRALDCR